MLNWNARLAGLDARLDGDDDCLRLVERGKASIRASVGDAGGRRAEIEAFHARFVAGQIDARP